MPCATPPSTPGWRGLAELAEGQRSGRLPKVQASVADYFDYYNHARRHSSIGYLKPHHSYQQQLADFLLLN